MWAAEHPGRTWLGVDGTLVFADICGFTVLSERLAKLGPIGGEELTEVLERCFTDLLAVVFQYVSMRQAIEEGFILDVLAWRSEYKWNGSGFPLTGSGRPNSPSVRPFGVAVKAKNDRFFCRARAATASAKCVLGWPSKENRKGQRPPSQLSPSGWATEREGRRHA